MPEEVVPTEVSFGVNAGKVWQALNKLGVATPLMIRSITSWASSRVKCSPSTTRLIASNTSILATSSAGRAKLCQRAIESKAEPGEITVTAKSGANGAASRRERSSHE